MRIGIGYDVHQLVEGRPLWLGGVEIPHTHGLLGAAALGDIGAHFPDTDPQYKGIDSKILLHRCGQLLAQEGYTIANIDSIIVAQQPKLAPYISQIRQTLADTLGIDIRQVSVKATTSEHLGFEGRKEGISAHASVLLN